ncbi:MAG: ATP-binding cassette domain-containing protein [Bacteroidota bacterium]
MAELKHHIRISDNGREIVAIDDFRVAESCITVLFGESGIGKSLSALAICGLLDPDELEIQVDGHPYDVYLKSQEVAEIRRNGFFVFQEPSSHLNPLLTLQEQLNEGSLASAPRDTTVLERLWPGGDKAEIQKILDVYPKPYRPSGGEKQRILAAMAFRKFSIVDTKPSGSLFVFDEPTGNLDNNLRNVFLDLLVEEFRRRSMTVLLITHDYSMISRLSKNYPDLTKRILYKELTLDRGKLRLRDFLPQEYLSWIAKLERPSIPSAQDETLLSLEPEIRVFGRSLVVSQKKSGRTTPLQIRKGQLMYLKAPSGMGKTTLLKVMMGLVKSDSMKMRLKGVDYSERTHRRVWQQRVWGRIMTMVFQHADEALNQNSDVRGVFDGLPIQSSFDDAAIVTMLSELFEELPDGFLVKLTRYLSGGQKQRLNLLRSIVLDTDILLLDEPLNGLDFSSSVKVIGKIEEKLKAGKGVMVISHNEEIFDTLVATENVYELSEKV